MKYIILTCLMATACAHAPPVQNTCCQRLDVRTKEMQDFNRYCKVLIVARATNKDPQAQESIQSRLGVCRFVFGVGTNEELLSTGPDVNFHKVQAYHVVPEEGWRTPLDCDPSEPTCEEF